eukprot:SAG22_NODE_535_length_9385_cov_6.941202_4_plen_306_part_00
MRENGPTYVQLNLPLYDDDVLYLVPRSHHRLTTPEELAAMAGGLVGESRSFHAPLPGAVRVQLRAGDLAVYLSPTILHWGSSYQSLPLRRTLHGGYSTTVGACLGPDIWPELHQTSAAAFERWQRGSAHKWVSGHWIHQRGADTATSHQAQADAMQAVAAGDLPRFLRSVSSGPVRAGFPRTPGPAGLRLKLIQLAHTAKELAERLGQAGEETGEEAGTIAGWKADEVAALWHRLRPVSEAMQCSTLQWQPGFQGAASLFPCAEVPAKLLDLGSSLALERLFHSEGGQRFEEDEPSGRQHRAAAL